MAVSGVSTHIRLSGMASGLDTDKIIEDLMKAERVPLDKVIQNKQTAIWKRDDYRAIITKLNDFYKSFLDVTNPTTNMRSQNQYKSFLSNITSSSGATSNALTATGTTGATVGTHTVIVKKLATAAQEISSSTVSSALKSGTLTGNLELQGKQINVTLDGVTKKITFDSNYNITDQATGDAFASDFQNLIKNAFGTGINSGLKVTASYDNATGNVTFNTGAGATQIKLSAVSGNDTMTVLGINDGASNRINTSSTLLDLKDTLGSGITFYDDEGVQKLKFTINNKEFTFTSDTTLANVINTINNDTTANVNFSYDTITDKFVMSSKKTGAGQSISITNTWGNFFGSASATGINHEAAGFGAGGTDAQVVVDGQELVRSSNTFTEAGVTYSLAKADPNEEIKIELKNNVDGVYDNIKNFINKYNDILSTIYTKLNEKPDKDYPPLTDSQKEAMSEEEIENWEKKAKTGLLRSDPTLLRIVNTLRMQMIETVEGANATLSSIGISSKSAGDYGQLTIDETKLKKAIANDSTSVMTLFSKQSATYPDYDRKATLQQKNERLKEEGLAQRIYDIIQDNVSIVMDSSKQKGFLLEKAGMIGDSTDRTSVISKQIDNYLEAISDWEDKLAEKEESYYKKFTAMEKALSKLNSQSSWISNQLSGSSS